MTLITGITPQESFPKQDVSDANAEMLVLLLSNRELRGRGHVQAEKIIPLYRIGHQALRGASGRLHHAGAAAMEAFDFGVGTYEAMAALVRARVPDSSLLIIAQNATRLATAEHGALLDVIEEANERFIQEMPNARGVVVESTERFHPHAKVYASLGAAVARQFELEAAV